MMDAHRTGDGSADGVEKMQGKMKAYLIEKLFDINYRMAIHEGNANQRLASEAEKILLLPPSEVPERYKNEFDKLSQLVEEPIKLGNIRNSTASKYIKLLIDILDDVCNE